jgi:acetyl-CoA C-acetyltransferase
MALDPRTPVIVGVGQFLWRAQGLTDALEPIALMEQAIRNAVADAGLAAVPPAIGSIRVVNSLSWRYGDPAGLLAVRLGTTAAEHATTPSGGNVPQAIVNRTALDIAAGLDLAVIVGGEAWRTRSRATREGARLDWDTSGRDDPPPVMLGDELPTSHPAEAARGIVLPVQVYPMFETAVRAAAGREPAAHRRHIAEIWSRFSAVAASNEHAWSRAALTADEIATVTAANRVIGWPYTKVMNANNDVDMAAAIVMCSSGHATSLGIPRDQWVFPHAGVDCHEHIHVSHRDTFAEVPAVRAGGRRALDLAGVGIDDIDLVDLYSCFPSAVQLGAAALGLDTDRQLTRTGGLAFAGGPWNNYTSHAIATVVDELRRGVGARALVWANGGFATKHAFGVYAARPRDGGFRHERPQAAIDALPRRDVAGDAAGPATVEAYTVMHDRTGAAERGLAACLLPDGRRAWATTDDADTMAAMEHDEWVDRPVTLAEEGVLRA